MGCGATKTARSEFDEVCDCRVPVGAQTLQTVESTNRDEGVDFDEASYGVRSSVLKELIQTLKREELAKLTTSKFCEQHIRPLTTGSKNSYTQQLFNDSNQRHKVGRAAICVTHAWSQNVLSLFDSILHFVARNQLELGEDPVIWLDVLSVSQHEAEHVDQGWWLKEVFHAVSKMRCVVVVIGPIFRPAVLSRLWVMYEVLATVVSGVQLAIAFPPDQKQRFLDGLVKEPAFFLNATALLDCSACECTVAADRAAILNDLNTREFSLADVEKKVRQALDDAWLRLVKEEGTLQDNIAAKGEAQKAYGKLLGHVGRGAEAVAELEASVKTLTAVHSESGKATLDAMSTLSIAYASEGRMDEGKRVAERVLAQGLGVLGEEDTATMTARSNLARAYADANQHDKALAQHQAVLAARTAALGTDDEQTLQAMISTGAAQHGVGDYPAAEATLLECLSKRKVVLGPDHQATGLTMSWLGSVYMAQGRIPEAYEMKVGCLEVYRKALGPDHRDTKQAEDNVAVVERSLGRKEAEP